MWANGAFRHIRSPLTDDQLEPLTSEVRVQLDSPLVDSEYERLARFLERYPNVYLRLFGEWNGRFDLNLLSYFPKLTRLSIDLLSLEDLGPLAHLSPDLTHLDIGEAYKRTIPLGVLRRFQRLQALSIVAQKSAPEVVPDLSSLRYLELRGLTCRDLAWLESLDQLSTLVLHGGGTTNVGSIPQLHRLQRLVIGGVRGLSDIEFLSRMDALRSLHIYWQRQIQRFPNLERQQQLSDVWLDTLHGLTGLEGLAAAPQLQRLLVTNCKIDPQILLPFANHPALRCAEAGLGAVGATKAAKDILSRFDSCPMSYWFDRQKV